MAKLPAVLPPVRRPQVLREVEMLARAHTETAVGVLLEVATNKKAQAAARVSAAEALLDRGWGRARQVVTVDSPVERLTDEQLDREIGSRLRELAILGEQAIDVEFEEHVDPPEDEGRADPSGPGGPEDGGPAGRGPPPGDPDLS